jgi:hypothetical protein
VGWEFESCALVGNSGRVLAEENGAAIDQHDVRYVAFSLPQQSLACFDRHMSDACMMDGVRRWLNSRAGCLHAVGLREDATQPNNTDGAADKPGAGEGVGGARGHQNDVQHGQSLPRFQACVAVQDGEAVFIARQGWAFSDMRRTKAGVCVGSRSVDRTSSPWDSNRPPLREVRRR